MAKQGRLSRFLFGSYEEAKDVAPPTEQDKEIEAGNASSDNDRIEAVSEEAPAATPVTGEPQTDDTGPEPERDETETASAPQALVTESETETEHSCVEVDIPEIESSIEDVEQQPSQDAEEKLSASAKKQTEGEDKLSWFQRLKRGLSRSSGALGDGISSIFTKRKLDDDTLQDLEDILIQADLGVETAMNITDRLSEGRYNKQVTDREVQEILAEEVDNVLAPVALPLEAGRADGSPHVILMIGVNGAGKTTTIGKMAQKFRTEGKSVMLAAGDTFRAAAIDQLKVWGERTDAPVISRDVGADAAGLAYDAMLEAKQQGKDVLMIDTAGRLQNRTELMAELEKIVRVIKKHDPDAPHSVLLVLDATTGQNALNQVEVFSKIAGVTGLVMTKLDGTARGGILVAISAKYKVPVHFIGVGEGVEDLEPFESGDFARAIAGLAEE